MRLLRVRVKEREHRAELAAMVKSGLTYEQIRERTGCSYATITKAVDENGLRGRQKRREKFEEPKHMDRMAVMLAEDFEEDEPEGRPDSWVLAKLRTLR